MKKPLVYLLLCDIRSAHNVGAMFRTADAAGVSEIFLSGTTPRPVDRFGRPVSEIAKTALGAEKNVPWHYVTAGLLLTRLKKAGVRIVALEQSAGAVDYKKARLGKQPTLFVVGNEVKGLSKKILSRCDVIAEIPMRGKKESLNVSVALGVALFRILNI